MTDEFIGKQIGGYEVLDRLGVGGMATVYRVRQSSMNRVVALKILPRHFMRDDTYLQRFDREVKIVAQLEHRNIVPVFDYGEYDGQPYIVMRYMSGGSVDDVLAQGPLSLDMMLSITEQVAPALDYAHAKNVLHRDLKPSNVLMDDDGGAYITDFGIARILGSSKGETITTQGVVGTPSYMSPEQAQGHTLDGRSDIYSLGVMLFEMATGRRPFENETPYSIAVMQVTQQPPSPRTVNPAISTAIEQVILKALKKKPENRYQTAVEMAEALKMAIERPAAVGSTLDTQPSNIRDMQNQQEGMGATQPAGYMPPRPQPQVVLPQAVPYQPISPPPQQAVYPNLPPTSGNLPGVYRPPTESDIRRRRKPRRGNFWVSVILGGIIGCALLSAVVVAMAFAVSNFINNDTVPTNVTDSSSGIRPLDATSEAARNQLIPGVVPNSTPLYVNATPIPTRPPEEAAAPTITPDTELAQTVGEDEPTRFIYFAEREGNYDLYLFNLADNSEFRVTENENTDSYPMASPDGQRIAFQSNRDGDFDLYLIGIDGRDLQRLTDNALIDRLPAWSPDGNWIVYSSDTRGDGNYDIYRMQVDEDGNVGEVDLLVSNGQRNSRANYSGDGRYITYTTGNKDDANTWEIAVMEVETGEIRNLTDNTVRDYSPTFSPDGETVLFVTDGEGRAAIATIPFSGGDAGADTRVIYDGSGYEWGVSYSPDGQYVLFNSELDGASTIYFMRADGTEVSAVPTLGGYYPSWVR